MRTQVIQWIKVKRLEICCIFILLVVLGGSWVGNTAKINVLLSMINKQKHEIVDIKAEVQLLESKVIELKSAKRIIPLAEQKLGLIKPTTIPIVILDTTSQQ